MTTPFFFVHGDGAVALGEKLLRCAGLLGDGIVAVVVIG